MLRAVAFDLGGVLVDVDHDAGANVVGVARPLWDQACFADGAHDALTIGALDATAFLRARAATLGVSEQRMRSAWRRVVTVRVGARELIGEVASLGLTVCVWSNTDAEHADAIARELPCVHDANGLSFRIGQKKPSAAFFAAALPRDIEPRALLFIDDLADNVDAARRHGCVAAQVVGDLAAVRAALRNHGAVPDPKLR